MGGGVASCASIFGSDSLMRINPVWNHELLKRRTTSTFLSAVKRFDALA
jgi:hypothetical protein